MRLKRDHLHESVIQRVVFVAAGAVPAVQANNKFGEAGERRRAQEDLSPVPAD
jgi:hypothetical protein